MFAENFTEGEASALSGAFGNQIKAIRRAEAASQNSGGEQTIKWGWPEWGNRRQMKD